MALTVGARVTLEVERPVAGGRMLARHEGQVVFVAGAVPGERVLASVERVAKGTIYADTVDVLTPSPDRRPGVEGRCGGSDYSHIAYPRQLLLKGAVIEDAWRRLARRAPPGPVEVLASPERGYRMRARLHAADGALGFYREGTHRLCDAGTTGQLSDDTMAWVRGVEEQLRAAAATGLTAIDVVENADGTERACHLSLAPRTPLDAFTFLGEGIAGVSAQVGEGGHGATVLVGQPNVVDQVGGRVPLRHDVRSFFQGNRFLLEPLVQLVLAAVPEGPVLDLYAGTGLFGLSAAAAGRGLVVLVEGDAWSGRDLAANARPFADAARVERRGVEAFLASARPGHATWIVDPPRTGLAEAVRRAARRDEPSRIVYVSCDVATLARDVQDLCDVGYDVASLTGVDMFPSTGHVEAVCVLTRP
jgi:tRNA/tmRNA/rRNA uracil-C5-methylase (TrmA/RlmC/RlmD family)